MDVEAFDGSDLLYWLQTRLCVLQPRGTKLSLERVPATDAGLAGEADAYRTDQPARRRVEAVIRVHWKRSWWRFWPTSLAAEASRLFQTLEDYFQGHLYEVSIDAVRLNGRPTFDREATAMQCMTIIRYDSHQDKLAGNGITFQVSVGMRGDLAEVSIARVMVASAAGK
jgi:hypothetical protein